MKLLLDFFPILLFFGTFKAWGIMAATAVAIAATLVQIGYLRYKNGFVVLNYLTQKAKHHL